MIASLQAQPGEQLIYVYEDPAVDWSHLIDCYLDQHGVVPWRHEEGEHAQNMGEVWIHQGLLRHPLRTKDPEKASLFYIPLYAAISSDSEPLLGSLQCNGITHLERVDTAMDYLEKESKYFMRFGGADHFFACG